jgi:phosphate/phosphite/phosphonate ABC transporter binding protein
MAAVIVAGVIASWLGQTLGGFWAALIVFLLAMISAWILVRVLPATGDTENRQKEPAGGLQKQQIDVNMYDIAEGLSFISQQLVWVVGQSRTALKKLTVQSNDIARESETTASSAEETSAGVEEIAANSAVVSNASRQALQQCQDSSRLALTHQREIAEASNIMLEVAQVVQSSVVAMDELNASSKKIGEFVGKIQGIASQTNLLALNAAIEAARAGEAGRGFAVVAEEVRKLASESEVITHEVEENVKDITERTKRATSSMQAGKEKIEGIEQTARKSAEGMREVVETVKKIEDTVQKLCDLSSDQQSTTEQMAIAVESIGNATVEIAGNTQEALHSIGQQEKGADTIYEFAQTMTKTVDKIQEIAVHFKKETEIVFGFNPFTAPQVIKENYTPILEEVARKIGCVARVIIVSDYDSLGRSLLNGTIDVGWFSPFAYVSAKSKGAITALVTTVVNKNASYTGYIIARKDQGITSLEDLRNKRFAFVDQQSASGYVYPRYMLIKQGKDPDRYFSEALFLGSHNRVIDGVLDGTVDAGGTYSEAVDAARSKGLHVDDLIILAKTDPIPKDAIAARPQLDAALVNRLRQAFMETADTTSQYASLMKKSGLNGFIEAQDEVYDVIRNAAKVLHK